MSRAFSDVKDSLTIGQVATHFGYEPNRAGFIFSPFAEEKSPSCKLYFETNSFYDFSTNFGGDLIRFAAAVLHCGNWEACRYLAQAFSLPVSFSGSSDRRPEIERRQIEQQRREVRKREFWTALFGEVTRLKKWEDAYRTVLEKKLFEPFSDDWGYCINELHKTERKLDVLCAADQMSYRRLKSNVEAGLSSDRPTWLLDCAAVLSGSGAFRATDSELEELDAQRRFGLTWRPGKDRGCRVVW